MKMKNTRPTSSILLLGSDNNKGMSLQLMRVSDVDDNNVFYIM